jgi:exoribonuclease R
VPTPRRRLLTDPAALGAGFDEIRREHAVPIAFPPDATASPQATTPGSRSERVDLRDVPFVTLDPPGSRDLDQAMHLERVGAGYRVRYAIADVAAFVVPGGALDRALHERVVTVYCPDVRVPLHPTEISEGAASLLPGVERPAIVWDFSLDSGGDVTHVDVARAHVRSRAQLDYAGVQRTLDDGSADEVARLLVEVGVLRAGIERARGGVSLPRPEQEVVDAPGGGWALEFRAPLPVEHHNAQLSLMTGMAAATIMLDAGVGVLRTMPATAPEALARLRRRALGLGVPWPTGASYPEALAALDPDRPATAAFLAAAATLFRGAAWEPFRGQPPRDVVHGAVAAPYAHVTAPLRRLVDRYGLEVCLAAAAGRTPPEWVLAGLEPLRGVMAAGSQRAAAVDRACTDLVEAMILAPHVGGEFDAVALDNRTVQLRTPAVVARTEDEDLTAGTRLTVRLLAADPSRRTVTFARVR